MTATAAAERRFAQVLVACPDDQAALHGLGLVRRIQGRGAEAARLLRRASIMAENPVPALVALAGALREAGRATDASRPLLQAVVADPAAGTAWAHLGSILGDAGATKDAVACLRRAVALQPDQGEAWLRLAVQLRRAGQWRPTMDAAAMASRLAPQAAEPYAVMADAQVEHGRVEEGLALYRRALGCADATAGVGARMLMALHYSDAVDAKTCRALHEDWARRHAAPAVARPPRSGGDDPARRLRIGFVSGDFRVHSVGYFFAPLLEALDREQFAPLCFFTSDEADHVTRRMAAMAEEWHDVAGLDDAVLARRIASVGVDVLVDLSGHTRHNRLLAFARKPAPVQVTWLGYPGTTGLAAMDIRLTDAVADPDGEADGHCVERLVRLDGPFLCYAPPALLPDVGEPPCLVTGTVTFGSFNVAAKLSPSAIALWARVLKAVPGSRLLLKNGAMGDPDTREAIAARFAAQDVAAERLIFVGRTPGTQEHLACYGRVDIALDTMPYNGTTTTCEALAMGVPVIALSGHDHRSRVGATLLRHAGLEEFVTGDETAYVALAAQLAAAPDRLRDLRRDLRPTLLGSRLCDRHAYARAFGDAIRTTWAAWCAGAATDWK